MKKIGMLISLLVLALGLGAQGLRPDSVTGLLKASDDFRDVTIYRSPNQSAISAVPLQAGISSFGKDFSLQRLRGGTYLILGFSMPNEEGGSDQIVTMEQDGQKVQKQEKVYRGTLREALVVADGNRRSMILSNPTYHKVMGAPTLEAWFEFKGAKGKEMAEYLVFIAKAKSVKIRLRSTEGTKDYELTPAQVLSLRQVGEAYLTHFTAKKK